MTSLLVCLAAAAWGGPSLRRPLSYKAPDRGDLQSSQAREGGSPPDRRRGALLLTQKLRKNLGLQSFRSYPHISPSCLRCQGTPLFLHKELESLCILSLGTCSRTLAASCPHVHTSPPAVAGVRVSWDTAVGSPAGCHRMSE